MKGSWMIKTSWAETLRQNVMGCLGWKIMEQLNVSQVLMWLTRACVLWLLCTSLPLFLYPWATLGFSLFFEHASCDGISSFCVVAVFGLECSCRTFMSNTLLLFRSQLGLFRSNNLQKPLSPSLPQYSVLFLWWLFSRNDVEALLVICSIATSLFWLQEFWFYLGSWCAHPNTHLSCFALCLQFGHWNISGCVLEVSWQAFALLMK